MLTNRTSGILLSVCFVICLLIPSSLFFPYLWNREHYQFFPFLFAISAWMMWQNGSLCFRTAGRLFGSFRWFFSIATAIILVTAVVIRSPWLSGVAFVLVLISGSLWYTSIRNEFNTIAIACQFLLILPPPFRLDVKLIQGLQAIASRFSSLALDSIGIEHLMRGNLMFLEGKSFFVEEACAGVHSMFALAAGTAALCIVGRRHWFPSLMLVTFSLFWAIVCNGLRIIAVAIGWTSAGLNLAEGWQHEVLGFIVFVLAIGLCWSTACIWDFLTSPVKIDFASGRSRISKWWNRLAIDDPTEESGPAEYSGSRAFNRFVYGCSILTIVGLTVGANRPTTEPIRVDPVAIEKLNAAFNENLLADDPDRSLAVMSHESKDREYMSAWGRHSRIWNLQTEFGSGRYSVDYPWEYQHDLPACYESIGWQIADERQIDIEVGQWPMVLLTLKRPGGASATLIYCMLDANGNTNIYPLDKRVGRGMRGLVQSGMQHVINRWRRGTIDKGLVQIQLFVPEVLPENEVAFEQSVELFRDLRRQTLDAVVSKQPESDAVASEPPMLNDQTAESGEVDVLDQVDGTDKVAP